MPGCPEIGLRPIVTSDGPSGVRGLTKDERTPSTSLPCPSALGATWDPGLVRELAAALGREARGKAVDVLLGPDHQPDAHPAGRPRLRVLRRGPGAHRPAGRGLRAGRAVRGRRGHPQALRGQRQRDPALDLRRARSPGRCCASCTWCRSRPASPRPGRMLVMAAYNRVNGASMTENPAAAARRAQGRVGLRRRGRLGLARGPQHRGHRAGRARPGPCPARTARGPRRWPRPSRTARSARRSWTTRSCGCSGWPAGSARSTLTVISNNLAGRPGPAALADGGLVNGAAMISPDLLRRAAAASFVLLRNEARRPAARSGRPCPASRWPAPTRSGRPSRAAAARA